MTDAWRTSTYTQETNCVEVAVGRMVLVRDTKDREGGLLAVSASSWVELLHGLATR